MLDDLYKVGPAKPLAYETRAELRDRCGLDIAVLRADLESKGLKTIELDDTQTMAYSGALYVYDEDALNALLEQNSVLLQQAGWPQTAEEFICKIANHWVPEKTGLFDLVADAFADKDHPGRTDVRVPDHDDRYQPAYLDMLRKKERAMATASAARTSYTPR